MAGNLPEQTVASKAQYGIYPWPIGNECLAREFRTVKMVDGKRVHSEPVKGCPSCRVTPVVEEKPTTEVDELKMRIAELEEQLKAKKQPVSYECAECEFGSTTEHGLKIHMGQRHKKEKK